METDFIVFKTLSYSSKIAATKPFKQTLVLLNGWFHLEMPQYSALQFRRYSDNWGTYFQFVIRFLAEQRELFGRITRTIRRNTEYQIPNHVKNA